MTEKRLLLILVSVVCAPMLFAQTVLEGVTPPGVGPGAPVGSSSVSDFEHYNSFGGTLSASLPLYHVGGRGEAGFNLVWNLQQTWLAMKEPAGAPPYFIPVDPYPGSYPASSPNSVGLGGAGVVYSRTGGSNTSCGGYSYAVNSTVTTLIFVAGDRTEINLTDAATNGRAYAIANPCGSQPNTFNAGRGASFLSKDGSNLIFVADSGVLEHVPSTYGRGGSATVSGNLYFPNGLNYRIDNSNVTWIRDRNGNKIQIQYSGPMAPVNWDLSVPAPTQVIDSLGRTTSINYNDASCGGCTSVTYPGVGGALRAVHIGLTNLSKGLLRSGYSISVMGSLFPEGFQTTSNFDPILASSVQFADGSEYQFQYNNYGELARVTVPTGGAIEYDYGDGNNGHSDGWQGGTANDLNPVMIYRRLQERREYAAGGSGLTARTHYTVSHPGSTTADTISSYDAAGNLLAQTVHTLAGSPVDALTLNGTGCNAWNEGLEQQVDSGLMPGTQNALVTIKNAYAAQTGCMSNPQLQTQTTTLHDTNQAASVSYAYDAYNNVTDKKEYDFGANGVPGALLRETATSYQYFTGTSNGVSLWMLNRPLVVTVGNGSTVSAETHYGYDESPLTDDPGTVGHDSAFTTALTRRGNLTNPATCLNPPSCTSWINHPMQYDVAGNVIAASDGVGNWSRLGYNDDEQNRYAFVTSASNAAGQKTTSAYDYASGKLTDSYDVNGNHTHFTYGGAGSGLAVDRLMQVTRPNGGSTSYSFRM